jgi:NADPH:quinone reductase-like Zn-dependent oxidoreductase
MKAMLKDRYGGPEVLQVGDVDRPEVGPEQVLVRVHASSTNAHDWHMLRGKPYLARLSEGFRRPKEQKLGLDAAGVVEAVGSEVTHLRPGDRVFGSRYGAFAEYVAGKNFVPIPDGLEFEQAAAIPTAGLTALQGLRDKGELQSGQRVLINGAGGGVGHMAVQIAKALGADVTAVTGARSADLARSIGADHVIDRRRENFTRLAARYDLVLDVGGTPSLRAIRRVLTRNGRIVMVAPHPGQWIGPVARIIAAVVSSRFSDRKATAYLAQVSRDDLLALAGFVESGKLKPVIDRTYPFEQIPDAIRYLESGQVRGKVVIRFG